MSLMELRLFGAKPVEDAEQQSTAPRLTLARRLAQAISAYAEAAAMARSTPFELHLHRRAGNERPRRTYSE